MGTAEFQGYVQRHEALSKHTPFDLHQTGENLASNVQTPPSLCILLLGIRCLYFTYIYRRCSRREVEISGGE